MQNIGRLLNNHVIVLKRVKFNTKSNARIVGITFLWEILFYHFTRTAKREKHA